MIKLVKAMATALTVQVAAPDGIDNPILLSEFAYRIDIGDLVAASV